MTATTVGTPRRSLLKGYAVVANVLAVLVLLQAVIAGQATFGDWEIEVHGWMGNGSFLLGVVLVALALAARVTPAVLVAAGALALALFAQTGTRHGASRVEVL